MQTGGACGHTLVYALAGLRMLHLKASPVLAYTTQGALHHERISSATQYGNC